MGTITNIFRRLTGQAAKPAAKPASHGRAFAGAAVNRLTTSMASWSGSVNMDLDGNNVILRARARALAQDNEYGRRFLSQVAGNIVGRTGRKSVV